VLVSAKTTVSGSLEMMNGAYSMHLYCDTPKCRNGKFNGEYTGRDQRDSWAQARKEGWHRHRNPHGGWLYFCGDCKRAFSGDSGA
jgi:hypothetical protein